MTSTRTLTQGCILLGLVLFVGRTSAEVDYWRTASKLLFEQNRPLAAVVQLEKGVAAGSIDVGTMAQFYAITGDVIGTKILFESASKRKPAPPANLPPLTMHPALDAIAEAARDRRVVILNEDHHSQSHRVFAQQLAQKLRLGGFTHFGGETFGPELERSLADGAPDTSSGIYTVDPIFADMVRRGAGAGYTFFAYEQGKDETNGPGSDSQLTRENVQAGNIAAILRADPKARVFLFVGSGHINESPDLAGRKWMAQILAESTGIDPLTINQVVGTPRNERSRDGALYKAVEGKFMLRGPSVFVEANGSWLSVPGADLSVFHPRDTYRHGRPVWLGMDGYRQPCNIRLRPDAARTMVRAFVEREDGNSIPMDQILAPPRATKATLMLPAGSYRVVRESVESSEPLGKVVVGRVRGSGFHSCGGRTTLPVG